MPSIAIIVPVYNEGPNIEPFYARLKAALNGHCWTLCFINDGSTDDTAEHCKKLHERDERISIMSFIKNYGQQTALRAGIMAAQADYIITMDGDLQHPPEMIPSMVEMAKKNSAEIIVMTAASSQKGLFKDLFSRLFYRLFSLLSGVRFHHRASDFRLISKNVQSVIKQLPERKIFLRAELLQLGFPVSYLPYPIEKRNAGTPAYTFGRSLNLAIEALFNSSTLPIRGLFFTGLFFAGMAFSYGLIQVGLKLFTHWNLPGFTDIVASVLFLGGLNLVMLSVIAKYLQIVLDHVKQRPEYLVDTSKSTPYPHNRG